MAVFRLKLLVRILNREEILLGAVFIIKDCETPLKPVNNLAVIVLVDKNWDRDLNDIINLEDNELTVR